MLFTSSREIATYVVEYKSYLADPEDLEHLDHYMEQAIDCCKGSILDDYLIQDEEKEASLEQEQQEQEQEQDEQPKRDFSSFFDRF